MKNTKPTRTTNRLPFSELEPKRFEDLCLNLIHRHEKWEKLSHYGRGNGDGGVDILAVKKENEKDQIWYVQCKRYKKIVKADLKQIVEKVVKSNILPDKLLVIVSCDPGKSLHEFLQNYSFEKGIKNAQIWNGSVLEAKLYKDYPDLLFNYFGLEVTKKQRDNTAKIKHSLRMEKRVTKELINHEAIKVENRKLLTYQPWYKFISSKVFIRSIDDISYPNKEENSEEDDTWFRTFFYDTYHNGIDFWLDGGMGATILMDENENWEPILKINDTRRDGTKYKTFKAMTIGRMPYHNIVGIKRDGDEYFSEPHLFCRFDYNGSPFEEIYYRHIGDMEKSLLPWELDKSKRTILP